MQEQQAVRVNVLLLLCCCCVLLWALILILPCYTADVQEQQAVRGSVPTGSNIYPERSGKETGKGGEGKGWGGWEGAYVCMSV